MNSEEIISPAQLEPKITHTANAYEGLIDFVMKRGKSIDCSIGVDLENNWGIPYYRCALSGFNPRIFITKEIRQQLYNYLINGIIPNKMPDVKGLYTNVDENFILRCFKEDRENKATTYNAETKEYKAKYPHGVINYGQLPYTTEELVAKLNSL